MTDWQNTFLSRGKSYSMFQATNGDTSAVIMGCFVTRGHGGIEAVENPCDDVSVVLFIVVRAGLHL